MRSPTRASSVASSRAGVRLVERLEAVDRGESTRREVILRVTDAELRAEIVAEPEGDAMVVRGVAAGAGVARGLLVASSSRAVALGGRGVPVVLVMEDAEAEDVPGIAASRAVVTLHGITGGAAIIARGHGKPCVAAGAALTLKGGVLHLREGGSAIREETPVGVDASRGLAWFGRTRLGLKPHGARIVRWASRFAGAPIVARVEDASEVTMARELGAHGVVDAAGRMFVAAASAEVSPIDLAEVPLAVLTSARQRISRGGR